jgi:hypothetical protein
MIIEKRDGRSTSLVRLRPEGFLRGEFGSREDVPLQTDNVSFQLRILEAEDRVR